MSRTKKAPANFKTIEPDSWSTKTKTDLKKRITEVQEDDPIGTQTTQLRIQLNQKKRVLRMSTDKVKLLGEENGRIIACANTKDKLKNSNLTIKILIKQII